MKIAHVVTYISPDGAFGGLVRVALGQAEALAERGHDVTGRECSLLDDQLLRREVSGFRPDLVIHLGARTDLRGSTASDYAANSIGVENLIAAIEQVGADVHTVYASSRRVFAIGHSPRSTFDYKPSTPYGASKIEGERIVRDRGQRAGTLTIVRLTSIGGPWYGTPYRDFFDMIASGRYVNFLGSDPLKSFGYVGNAVFELKRIASAPTSVTNEQVYWLADYEPLRLSEWASLVSEAIGRPEPRSVPLWAGRAVAKVGDGLQRVGMKSVPLTTFRLNNLATDMVYDTTSTSTVAGELPFDLREGVRRTVEWYFASRGSVVAKRDVPTR